MENGLLPWYISLLLHLRCALKAGWTRRQLRWMLCRPRCAFSVWAKEWHLIVGGPIRMRWGNLIWWWIALWTGRTC